MGYMHINNLYRDQKILMFKTCYALEKIHGTSAHISYNAEKPSGERVGFFSGGENYNNFTNLFDKTFLEDKFVEIFGDKSVIVYGEAYGGKQQAMAHTYGPDTKFIVFDVMVNNTWLNVPNAEDVSKQLNLEFVDYVEISTTIGEIDRERDRESVQAIRNGVGPGKHREGVVLRPLEEFTLNGQRVMSKHKGDAFRETATPRKVQDPEKLKVLEESYAIANEWVTEMRLEHVLDKLPQDIEIKDMPIIIKAMIEDVNREGEGEFIPSKDVDKAIGKKTAVLFKQRLQKQLLQMSPNETEVR